jgi:DNA invertase Pin-like site-specific DNA recombinase
MKIGYARISTTEQSLALQRDALTAAGCAQVFEDKGVSGVAVRRPGLDAALAHVATGGCACRLEIGSARPLAAASDRDGARAR